MTILVDRNKEIAAIFVEQNVPLGFELNLIQRDCFIWKTAIRALRQSRDDS